MITGLLMDKVNLGVNERDKNGEPFITKMNQSFIHFGQGVHDTFLAARPVSVINQCGEVV